MHQGYIHSVESLGALDGPGLRTVVFVQGCPLRCQYCHNIDATKPNIGPTYTVDSLFKKVIKFKPYWGETGGVTVSGGEPTMQTDFLVDFFKKLKEEKAHITVDTSLFTSQENLEKLLPYVDYWMTSVKEFDLKKHEKLTGVKNSQIITNLNYLDTHISAECKIRLRYVIVPKLTDTIDHYKKLGQMASSLTHLDLLELLPYSDYGKDKWLKLYGKYPMEGVPIATAEDVQKAVDALEKFYLKLKY